MAIDGHVNIEPLLDKARILGKIHDGKGLVEAHTELEYAIGEIFGIPMSTVISDAIFGTVAADGSWSMMRFSTAGKSSQAGRAVGIEFSDSNRRVRLVQVDSSIQLWEHVSGSTWSKVIDFEETVTVALTDLEDVEISAGTNISGLCVKVGPDKTWVLGNDSSTNGVETWEELTDVTGHPDENILAASGTLWRTDGSGDITPIQLAGTQTEVGMFYKHRVRSALDDDQLINWKKYGDLPGDELHILEYEQTFELPTPGIYKISLSWRMTDGSLTNTVPLNFEEGVAPKMEVFVLHSSGIKKFPAFSLQNETWWAFENADPGVEPYKSWLMAWPLQVNSAPTGMSTFYLVSKGGTQRISAPYFALVPVHTIKGGSRGMDFYVDMERVA